MVDSYCSIDCILKTINNIIIMKKTFFIVLVALVYMLSTQSVFAKTPVCTTIKSGALTDVTGNTISLGYDQWGYNYQAHMFNGWYDNYSRPSTPVTGGDVLMMKWNDAWLSNVSCDGDNKLDRHYGSVGYVGSGAWLTNHASGTYTTHNITGQYVIAFEYQGGTWNHTATLSDTNGTVSGTGAYPASGPAQYEWQVTSGSVSGDTVLLTVVYTAGADALSPLTTMYMTGTINPDGSMTGVWTDNYQGGARQGTWLTAPGTAQTNACTWSDFVKIVAVPSTATESNGYWHTADGVEIGPSIWGDFAIIQEVSSDPCGQSTGLMNYRSKLRSGLGNW